MISLNLLTTKYLSTNIQIIVPAKSSYWPTPLRQTELDYKITRRYIDIIYTIDIIF